jgi:hypothetical protein
MLAPVTLAELKAVLPPGTASVTGGEIIAREASWDRRLR